MFISIISRIIIYLIGWNHISEFNYKQLLINNNILLFYSHTSYKDFYLLMLYYLSYHIRHKKIKLLIINKFLNIHYIYLNNILNYLGIKTYLDINNNNNILHNILNDINIDEPCIILIPFTFYLEHTEIYELIKTYIKFSTMSVGFDYEKKILKISPEIPSFIENDFVKKFIQHYISNIVPINIDNLNYKIRKHSKTSLFNLKRLKILTNILLFILFILFILKLY